MNRSSNPPPAAQTTPLRVGFVLAPEFTLLPFSGFVDVLRMAADETDRSRQIHCQWSVMSHDGRRIPSSSGTDVMPTSDLKDPDGLDYVVVVGGRLTGLGQTSPHIYNYIRKAGQSSATLVGLCTGSFLLAKAGQLSGHRCCLHWFHERDFRTQFPRIAVITDRLYVRDGKRITCPGGTSAIDLAIHLIGEHFGALRARKILNSLSIDSLREANAAQPHSAVKWFTAIKDNRIKRAVLYILRNLGTSMTVADVAQATNTSASTLNRGFQLELGKSVASFITAMRLSHASWDLLHTRAPITQIAAHAGFCSPSHFIKRFSALTGMTPRLYRRSMSSRRKRTDSSPHQAPIPEHLRFSDESIHDFFVIN